MPRLTVLGVGNPILADDGIGLVILEQLQRSGPAAGSYGSTELNYIDGGILGMEILPDIEDADYLLILDALAGPGEPGQTHVFYDDHIPRLMKTKLSPHQVGLLDLLSVARLSGKEPEKIAVVGVVAQDVNVHVGLSPAAKQGIATATAQALEILQKWL